MDFQTAFIEPPAFDDAGAMGMGEKRLFATVWANAFTQPFADLFKAVLGFQTRDDLVINTHRGCPFKSCPVISGFGARLGWICLAIST